MQAPRLEFVRTLAPLAAASGAVLVGDDLVVVADDELHLGVFPRRGAGPCHRVRVSEGTLPTGPKARKRAKPDHEAIVALPDGSLLLIPSGSKEHRSRGVLVRLGPSGTLATPPREVSFAALFATLRDQIGVLNIEGAVWADGRLLLFQRGNDADAINGIVSVAWPLAADGLDPVLRLELGDIRGVPFTFTDAAACGDHFFYTAAAEATDDAYADGAVAGSVLGLLSPSLEPVWQMPLGPEKFEGVAVARVSATEVELLLVTDADSRGTPSRLYRTLTGWPILNQNP